MADVRTGYGCPLCEKTTGEISEIIARDGRSFVCSRVAGHSWEDLATLQDLQPKIRFQQEQERPAPQQNQTNVNVSISVPLYNDLLAKYGDKLSVTLAGALKVIAEGEAMMISKEDLEQIERSLPEKPKNARHLSGIIFAMSQQVTEAKQEVEQAAEQLKAYQGFAPNAVMADLGQYMAFAAGRAKEENMPVKVWLDGKLKHAFENNWW